jgi:hypothetical protein
MIYENGFIGFSFGFASGLRSLRSLRKTAALDRFPGLCPGRIHSSAMPILLDYPPLGNLKRLQCRPRWVSSPVNPPDHQGKNESHNGQENHRGIFEFRVSEMSCKVTGPEIEAPIGLEIPGIHDPVLSQPELC